VNRVSSNWRLNRVNPSWRLCWICPDWSQVNLAKVEVRVELTQAGGQARSVWVKVRVDSVRSCVEPSWQRSKAIADLV